MVELCRVIGARIKHQNNKEEYETLVIKGMENMENLPLTRVNRAHQLRQIKEDMARL